VTVEFRARLQKLRVEPADLPAFRKFVKEATDDSSTWLSLEAVTKLADAPAVEAALKEHPDDSASALVLAQLYRTNGKPDEARRVLNRAARENPGEDKLLEASLQVADELKERARADEARVRVQLARNAFARGQVKDAWQHLDEAASAAPAAVQTAEALEFRGQLCEARGKPKDAAAAYEAWLKLKPDNPKPLEALVHLALAAGDRREAVDRWRHYTLAVGSDAHGLATAADFALRLDRDEDALDLAWRAARKDKPGAAVLRVRGLVYLRRAEYARAAKDLAAALDAAPAGSPPDGEALAGLIRAQLARGELSPALARAAQADRVTDPAPELLRLCMLLRGMDQRRAALEKICPAPSAHSGSWRQRVAVFVCAEHAHATGRPAAEVEQLLAASLAGGVDFGAAYGLRALRELDRGHLTQALADAEKAIAHTPGDPRGFLVRGRVRLERGTPGAADDLEKAALLSVRKAAATADHAARQVKKKAGTADRAR
jgi:tetratricopeptide (TPR) repeat protein